MISKLDYKIYKNSDKEEDYEPKNIKEVKLGTIDEFRPWILKESEKCGVLVYANGQEYEQLKLEDNITPVCEVKSHLALENMGVRFTTRFPVFLINADFGTRGLNFRAP